MAKNKLSKSKMKSLSKDISKYAKDISNTSNKLIKTIEEMNGSVYYGGEAANKWYKDADTSVTSNVKFLEKLENALARIDSLIKRVERVSGGTSDSTSGSAAAGAAAGIGAGAGLGGETPNGTTNQAAPDGAGKGSGGSDKETPKDPKPPTKKALVDNNNDGRFENMKDRNMREKKQRENDAYNSVLDQQNKNKKNMQQAEKLKELTPHNEKEQKTIDKTTIKLVNETSYKNTIEGKKVKGVLGANNAGHSMNN